MSNNLLIELTDRYLNGELTPAERLEFEKLRLENAEVNSRIDEHIKFTSLLKGYGEQQALKHQLQTMHHQLDVDQMAQDAVEKPVWIVQLWRNHHSKISVAASVAVFVIFSTLFFSGYFAGKSENGYVELKNEIERTKQTTKNQETRIDNIKKDIIAARPRVMGPGRFSGTGFALSANGYLVTNYHVVNGGDSVYVQNAAGESYHTKLVYTDAKYDVAILKIDDPAFKALAPLPYNFKRSKTDLGENVFTAGYPGDSLVCGRGYLASAAGLRGDTLMYEISAPVNHGNSGGPLWDGTGNIIGIIRGRGAELEGAAFAVKSKYLLKAIESIPADSLNSTKLAVNTTRSTMNGLTWPQQIKKMRNYVFMVKVYN